MTVAVLEHVTKRFGGITALDDVSLSIQPGSTVALLGPNGAGKTTLVAVMLGLRRPDSGSVRVGGRDPSDPRARRTVAAVPQETMYPQTLRVGELIDFAARHYERPRPVEDVLAQLGLAQLARRQIGGLSTGERRRVAVALALVANAALLVLDEPTTGIDPNGRRSVWQAVRAACASGAAAVVTTHQLDEAEAVATRVVAIDAGRVVADGSVQEVVARAGGALVRYRARDLPPLPGASREDGWVTIVTEDAGAAVKRLVAAGVELEGLVVRPLTLEEALALDRRRA